MNNDKRNVIITGAGSGIGAAVAERFAQDGNRLFLFDLSASRLSEVARGLQTEVHEFAVDLTDSHAVGEAIAQISSQFALIDVLVNCAGVFDGAAGVEATSAELWHKVLNINLTGAFNIVKPVSEKMIENKAGRIILIGSIAAQRAMPDGLAYCAAKAGLEGMTRRLAFDLGKYGITANLVAPGVIRTNIRATSTEILGDAVPNTNVGVGTNADLMNQLIPLVRGGMPSEVAATVHFLASEGAGYISGDVIHVDGGWIAS